MANSAKHWNGSILCAVDTETTGLDPYYHELIQVCILPLDSFIKPRKDVLPFNIFLKMEYPERMNAKVQSLHVKLLPDVERFGQDRENAKDLLADWVEKLGLPCTKYGNPKRMIPLGQNYAFDYSFLIRWLGMDLYDQYFERPRDTMIAASFLNDAADAKAETVPFPKVNLRYLCSTLKVENTNAHNALGDCLATAECYRRMLSTFIG